VAKEEEEEEQEEEEEEEGFRDLRGHGAEDDPVLLHARGDVAWDVFPQGALAQRSGDGQQGASGGDGVAGPPPDRWVRRRHFHYE
jgi:hypothetical protein